MSGVPCPPFWREVDYVACGIGDKANAGFACLEHIPTGACLLLFWHWDDGWYFEVHGHGWVRERLTVGLAPPFDPAPWPTKNLFEQAERVIAGWKPGRGLRDG